MTCFKFSRNHWLATDNIIRIGSFSLDLRGSLVHCPAHSRISCEPRAGQLSIKISKDEVCTTSLCHCLAVLMRKKSEADIQFETLVSNYAFFSSFSQHLSLLRAPLCLVDDLSGTGKLLYMPPNHFSRLKMPLCLSAGPVLQPQTIVEG